MERTVSAMVGKGSLNHNSRKFRAENVDGNRTHLNVEYCNENIKEVYHNLFDKALQIYNDKQKRKDRKIENYYEKIRTSKQEKLYYELIMQIGDKDNMSAESKNGLLAQKILDEYYSSFAQRNPQLKVFSAHIHMDEATPHLHIDFVPFTSTGNRGLSTRVSLKQALADQGFKGGTRSETEWNQWVKAEKDALTQCMERNGITRENRGNKAEHLSVLDYKKQERQKEVVALNDEINGKNIEYNSVVKRVNNLIKAEKDYKELVENLDSEEYELPEPHTLMSAKVYKKKIVEPLIEKLKKVAKKLLLSYFSVKDELKRVQGNYSAIYHENKRLEIDKERLVNENQKLRNQNKDYAFLRKVFGKDKIDELLNQAKEINKNKSRKWYER